MEIFPQSTKCINYYPLITKEFTGPKHFVITRVPVLCSQIYSILCPVIHNVTSVTNLIFCCGESTVRYCRYYQGYNLC